MAYIHTIDLTESENNGISCAGELSPMLRRSVRCTPPQAATGTAGVRLGRASPRLEAMVGGRTNEAGAPARPELDNLEWPTWADLLYQKLESGMVPVNGPASRTSRVRPCDPANQEAHGCRKGRGDNHCPVESIRACRGRCGCTAREQLRRGRRVSRVRWLWRGDIGPRGRLEGRHLGASGPIFGYRPHRLGRPMQ